MLIGLLLVYLGVYGAVASWRDLHDESVTLATIMLVVFVGTAIGGAVVLYVGGGMFWRNLMRHRPSATPSE
jgi:hypothetical protein